MEDAIGMSGIYGYTGTIAKVTITTTGEYTLTAAGATGGSATGSEINPDYTTFFTASAPGGDGAEATGTFLLQAGDVLDIAVGGAGVDGVGGAGPDGTDGSNGGGGGGGGSFIILQSGTGASATYTPLLVAGGGGGAGFFGNPLAGENAQASENGGAGDYVPETAGGHPVDFTPGGGPAGGTNGDGGDSEAYAGQGGGGFFTDGQGGGTGFDNDQTTPTLALSGGQSGTTADGSGGFGGGGAASNYAYGGGGGGYSGGGGGYGAGAGGGGSYDAAADANVVAAFNAAGNGSITIDLLCYLRGTRILTSTGSVPVEELRIGDLVMTRFQGIQPVKWIGRQSYGQQFVSNNRDRIPVRICAGALGEHLPARDLYVSPGHSMLVDKNLLLARTLVNGVTITQDACPERIDYFQIELETHDCVCAKGTWSETFADMGSLRDQFHNAAEFYALYPNQPPREAFELCAPRPERGVKLDAALRGVVARAANAVAPAALRGWVDRVAAPWTIEGWAQDMAHPELPVLLEVVLEDCVLGTILACDHREDLQNAGFGTGRCGFFFTSPIRLTPEQAAEIIVRRAGDGTVLGMTEACLETIGKGQEPVLTPVLRRVA
jgi:hypothetical protein